MLLYEKKVENERHIFGTFETVPSEDDSQLQYVADGEPSLNKPYFNDGHGGIKDENGNPVIVKLDGIQIIPKEGEDPSIVVVDPDDPNSIREALEKALEKGEKVTVEFMADTTSYGVIFEEGSDAVLEFNDHEYDPIPDDEGHYAGSSGTKTQAMQLLKDSTIIMKNGTITGNAGSPNTKMVIQNYSNLTLDNMVVQDAGKDAYVLSNNFGTIHLKNGTQLNATGNHVAFDLWYGMDKNGLYDDGVTVYIDTPDVVVNGPIEFGHDRRITSEEQFLEHTHLYVCEGYDIDSLVVKNSTSGSSVEYEFKFNDEIGYYELVPKAEELEVEDEAE